MREILFQSYIQLLNATDSRNYRYLYKEIDWNDKLICITGSHGMGKTTMILQHIKANFTDRSKAFYVNLDNIWFIKNSLMEFADEFHHRGGTHLFLDEIHRYPDWSTEINHIYERYPDLHIVFAGSSILEISKSNAYLLKRAKCYHLYGLSFREFLNFETQLNFPAFTLNDILCNHMSLVSAITMEIKVLPMLKKYFNYGYYPFFKEGLSSYGVQLKKVINTSLDIDLSPVENTGYHTIVKIKKLLMVISSLAPFSPNLTLLSSEIETNRASAIKYLGYLQKAGLINLVFSDGCKMGLLNKPAKIYLDNTNLTYALTALNAIKDNARETFFANQCAVRHKVATIKQGGFMIDDELMFEVGGKGSELGRKNTGNCFVAMDGIEIGSGNEIPLWLFGFTY